MSSQSFLLTFVYQKFIVTLKKEAKWLLTESTSTCSARNQWHLQGPSSPDTEHVGVVLCFPRMCGVSSPPDFIVLLGPGPVPSPALVLCPPAPCLPPPPRLPVCKCFVSALSVAVQHRLLAFLLQKALGFTFECSEPSTLLQLRLSECIFGE